MSENHDFADTKFSLQFQKSQIWLKDLYNRQHSDTVCP